MAKAVTAGSVAPSTRFFKVSMGVLTSVLFAFMSETSCTGCANRENGEKIDCLWIFSLYNNKNDNFNVFVAGRNFRHTLQVFYDMKQHIRI
jgi:hypothetical protein